jgi:hypothetical protein
MSIVGWCSPVPAFDIGGCSSAVAKIRAREGVELGVMHRDSGLHHGKSHFHDYTFGDKVVSSTLSYSTNTLSDDLNPAFAFSAVKLKGRRGGDRIELPAKEIPSNKGHLFFWSFCSGDLRVPHRLPLIKERGKIIIIMPVSINLLLRINRVRC